MSNTGLGTDKDVEALARRARKHGWTVEVTGGTHLRWTAPDGAWFTSPLTPGGRLAPLRIRRNLARLDPAGFGQHDAETEPDDVDLDDEVAFAVAELASASELIQLAGELGDADEAARVVRDAREALRTVEDRIWSAKRRRVPTGAWRPGSTP